MIAANALPPIALPVDVLQQHLVILGKTGSGKTYTAKGLVEHLLALGRRVCVLDPTGVWWGLLSSADGQREGFAVTVLGGEHGHVPITEHAGAAAAELVATGNVPAIIDLSGTTLGERHRFVERFAEAVFRVNKKPLHLVIDEADEFAPQSPGPEAARMLGAIDRIVRRGRVKGFRVMMISQRPAVLNKNVLTQANALIAMRLPASQDRKAIELWVKGQADEAQAQALLASLASLKKGEGWAWAPELSLLERRTFPRIATFDSSRTPEDGEIIDPPKRLADVDLDSLRASMAAAVKEAEDNDVARLKARVRELEKKSAAAPAAAVDPDELQRRVDGATEEAMEAVRSALTRGPAASLGQLGDVLQDAVQRLKAAAAEVQGVEVLTRQLAERNGKSTRHLAATPPRVALPVLPVPPAGRATAAAADRAARAALSAPQRKLLDAVAAWNAMGVERPSVEQTSLLAGYSPTSSTFDNLRGACRTAGLVDYPEPGFVVLTEVGAAAAEHAPPPASLAELHERIRGPLSGPERKLFDVLVHAGGGALAISNAAELAGYSASSWTFDNLRGRLRTLGLAVYPRKTTIAATAWLFPEGLA